MMRCLILLSSNNISLPIVPFLLNNKKLVLEVTNREVYSIERPTPYMDYDNFCSCNLRMHKHR